MSTANRVAIYARFSSDRQDERSIADQIALCRDYATRHGWTVAETFADHALSGASVHGRVEYLRLLADARASRFDIILAEDVDRFARNAADAMRFRELAEFAGVRIFTVADGEANELLFGFKGLMGAHWLKTHALKVRRGQEGRVRAGLAPGGRCYGYAPVPGKPGERVIVAAEAAIVLRVLEEFAAGRSPREIAHGLNRDRVPAPRGQRWNASTIYGNKARGYGILTNPLYRGVIRWNRVRMVKDPSNGKRIARVNDTAATRDAPAPALAIVPAELAARVDARRAAYEGRRPEQHRRARHLLSGLLRCAACGGGLSSNGCDKSGRKRVRCSTDCESGTCPAPATFYLDTIEKVILDRLRVEFRDPQVVSAYVKEYHAERQRLAAASTRRRTALERRLAAIEREAKHCVDMVVQGIGDRLTFGARTKELAAEREQVAAEIATLGAAKGAIALHPAVLRRFEQQAARLQENLARSIEAGDREAAEAIRELIETVTVRRDPAKPGGISVVITGRLDVMLGATTSPVWGTLVAGDRSGRSPRRFQLAATG